MSLLKSGGFFRRGKRSRGSLLSDESLRIQEERRYILTARSDFFVREAYKTLRTNLIFALTGEEGCKVVVVTSSLQSEGKSITAVNLAVSLAETDRRVLLIDCDMRRPKLSRLLDQSAPAGLSNLLLDPALLDKAVLKSRLPVDIILAGDIPPNPSELLGSPRMRRLLAEMRRRYDYIILDTPPINMVTDAVVLAPESDGVLFVVRADKSERGAVIRAVEQLEYARAKLLGFVLNGVDLEKSRYGYGKYRYGRYKRYGYGGYYASGGPYAEHAGPSGGRDGP
ncbi:MAG: CpsD/CapB family tyrosine-protein kinase [Oscillospiraceae bacterium]|nr:CpsD/CapB family tyrosine-protein kinase [Oscillospiraceae bacterium]